MPRVLTEPYQNAGKAETGIFFFLLAYISLYAVTRGIHGCLEQKALEVSVKGMLPVLPWKRLDNHPKEHPSSPVAGAENRDDKLFLSSSHPLCPLAREMEPGFLL